MSDEIIPVPRSLFLCDAHIGYPNGRVDLMGVFTTLHPAVYPHVRRRLIVFAQLSGGQGETPLFFELRRERDDELIRMTTVRSVRFPDRLSALNVVVAVEGVRFDAPGVYVVSLFCHNQWVCDTTITLT